MAGLLRSLVVILALACSPALAQVDANLQALLNALMVGTPVALLTPLPDGTIEVTSFAAPGERSAADAALLIERARIDLANLGIERPTGQQLARALAGGTIDVPTGRTQIGGVLPQGTPGVTVRSQVISAGNLPTIIGVSPGGVGPAPAAAAGGSANPPSGGLAGSVPPPQTPSSQQAPIVSPLPPASTAVPPAATPTPFIR
jgi:hypothetical protein